MILIETAADERIWNDLILLSKTIKGLILTYHNTIGSLWYLYVTVSIRSIYFIILYCWIIFIKLYKCCDYFAWLGQLWLLLTTNSSDWGKNHSNKAKGIQELCCCVLFQSQTNWSDDHLLPLGWKSTMPVWRSGRNALNHVLKINKKSMKCVKIIKLKFWLRLVDLQFF